MALVGVAGRQAEGHVLASYVLGLGLIVIGQAVGALQFCLEEHLMVEQGLSPHPRRLGLGNSLCFSPVLSLTPDSDVAAAALWHEDFAETFDQVAHSGDLIALTLASALALLLYNLVGNMVTTVRSCGHPGGAPHAGRLAHVARFVRVPRCQRGRRWTGWSFLELLGFALLVTEPLAYKEARTRAAPRSPPPIDRQRSHTA